MKKPCTGTIYKIDGKSYCVGEKKTKIQKGQRIKLIKSKKNVSRSKKNVSRSKKSRKNHN